MNIVYIRSGYKGIYPFIEQSIEESISHLNIGFHSVSPSIQPVELQKLLQAQTPVIVLMMIANRIPTSLIKVIKQQQTPLAFWFTEDPFYSDISIKALPFADYILTIDEGSYLFYQSLGYSNAYYFPLATNEEIYKPLSLEKEIDVLLAGYPYPNRIKLIQHLVDHSNLSLLLIGDKWKSSLKFDTRKKMTVKFIDQWITPYELNKFYNQAKIILNPHREYYFKLNKNKKGIQNISVNNRFFDIFSSGGFQLINDPIKVPKEFVSEHTLSYSNEEDCLTTILKYLNKPILRREMVKEGQSVTLLHHTFTKRMESFIQLISGSSCQ
jgi:spore maturation protein CgeB